jgi:phosphoglycolate phosphatase-like HAD superfamily hydrolase
LAIEPERIQAICFDVDGTLSDTDDLYVGRLACLFGSFQSILPRMNPGRWARRIVMAAETPGNFLMGLPDIIGLDDEIFSVADFLARHSHPRPREHRVIPGIPLMLEQLYLRYPLSVVSARDERNTHMFLEETGLSRFFQWVATAQTCAHTKPFPDPILWAAEKMNVSPEACLMVGDTSIDIRAGRSAGAQTAGVLCGFGEQEELIRQGADIILESTSDLLKWIP